MAIYVLVHGAFLGAWSWDRVLPHLRGAGHEAIALTLTGLGERAHLLAPDVGLETHVQDVVQLLEVHALHGVTLVGHSYSGVVIGCASHRVPERIGQLVYLDAFVPEHGKSIADLQVKRFRDAMRESLRESGSEWKVPPLDPSGESLGVTDPGDIEWLRSRMTPHPLRTLEEPAKLGNSDAERIPRTFVFCTGNPTDGSFPRLAAALRDRPDWGYKEIEAPHAAMFTSPELLSETLLEVAEERQGADSGRAATPPRNLQPRRNS